MARTTDEITWKPKGTGDFTLSLSVPKHADEPLVDNNTLSAPIAIREEKLKVLVVESYPRWEYRYLRNALSRDPGIDLSCLLFHPGLSKPGGGNKDYIKAFPKGLDELSKFDVVFLGDVGVENGQLTPEDCRQLKGLVEHQASGLVFMPGWDGRAVLAAGDRAGRPLPGRARLVAAGRLGLADPEPLRADRVGPAEPPDQAGRLAATRTPRSGRACPGSSGTLRSSGPRRAATSSASTRTPRTSRAGCRCSSPGPSAPGKVLFMGTDGAWRWRKGVEDKYHYRFWGQVVRWMAYQRNMAKGETMRLYYVPDQPRMDQTLTLHANVMEPGGEPVRQGEVSARITAPSGKSETVRFRSDGEEWGTFTGRFDPQEPGKYKVTLTCKETKATLEATLNVQGVAAERLGRPGPAGSPGGDRPGHPREGRQARQGRRDRASPSPSCPSRPRWSAGSSSGATRRWPVRWSDPRPLLGGAEVDRADLNRSDVCR